VLFENQASDNINGDKKINPT